MRSRRWSIGIGLILGLAVTPLMLLQLQLRGLKVTGLQTPAPRWVHFAFFVTPFVAVAVAGLLSARGSRLLAVAASVTGVLVGFGALALWLFLPALLPIEFVNETHQPVVVRYQIEGDDRVLGLGVPTLAPGQSCRTSSGFAKDAASVRILAERPDGTRIFDQRYTWYDLVWMGRRVVFTTDGPSP